MRRNSIEVRHEAQYLDHCYASAINDVQAASKLLQHALDIEESTRFLNDVAVKAWRIPQAPKRRKHRSNFFAAISIPDTMPLTISTTENLPFHTTMADANPAAVGGIEVEHAGDSDTEIDMPSNNAAAGAAFVLPALTSGNANMNPASPPFNFLFENLSTDDIKLLPLYWDAHLSRNLYAWLEHPETLSQQTELTHVDLQGPSGSLLGLGFDAQDHEKIKLIRILLPDETINTRDQREWLIVEVQHHYPDSAAMDLSPGFEQPATSYWLLAFPVSAVTILRSTGSNDRSQHITALTFGKTHSIPSMHGTGVPRRFAHSFMCACAKGLGVVEIGSERPLSQ